MKASDEIMIPRQALVEAIETELKDYFFDGVAPTLGQYAIDHIIGGILQRLPVHRLRGTDGAGKKAQGIGFDAGESKPTDVNSDATRLVHWHQSYGDLWQLKVAFEKKNNR